METENQKLRERVEEMSRETMLLAHTVTELTAKLKLATSAAPQPVDAAQAVPEWQLIKTAPKDGTLILLGRAEDEENDRGAISAPGRWHEEDHDGPDNMGHDAGFMDNAYQEFHWGRSFGNPDYMSKGFQPTHWMPLPAAPVAQPTDTTAGE